MKALRPLADAEDERGVFTSVADLTTEINRWAEHWNTDPKPFVWKATADDIIERSPEAVEPSTRSNHRRTTRNLRDPGGTW